MDNFRLANAALAIDIYQKLNEKSKTENFIFSPLCISSTLALAFKGAKGNTATEIEKVLHFECVKDYDFGFQTLTSDINRISTSHSLKIVKRLYVDSSYNTTKEFINSTKKPYPSELEKMDIKSRAEEARNQINTSVKDLTAGNVENVLTDGLLNENTSMLLLGAACYKGCWLYKFKESETKECEFHITKTETKPVQMMQLDAPLGIRTVKEQNLMILDIPFTGKQMSMLIIMPKCFEDDSTGLKKLEKELTCDNYVNWTNPSLMANSKVKLSLPKFTISSNNNVKDILKTLGINDAFNEEVADFSGMSEEKGLSMSEAIYEAYLDIGEDGTEAADVIRERVLMTKTEFNVDHPFLFVLKHNKTQGILLFGRYTGQTDLS
ncbi:serpin B5 [Anomaloglossus baeobatrachus]|uniref:serpin B5 n=1 Tax=Anomaloglossus baeobatrachus TaxID=238106 RepID=UPI003F4FEC94